jgi:hypothetical protein
MPLTNETHLRTALDALFYKDTILARLRAIDWARVAAIFPFSAGETKSAYFDRLCEWLAKRFQGYSITTVSGRFRAADLMTITAAAGIEEKGDRYLIDETTAIVRFIFPCGKPVRREAGSAADFEDLDPDPREALHRSVLLSDRLKWL